MRERHYEMEKSKESRIELGADQQALRLKCLEMASSWRSAGQDAMIFVANQFLDFVLYGTVPNLPKK